jgi:hypothetical protein
MGLLSTPARTMGGYRASPPAKRAGFWICASFAATVGVSRALNYVRERRRAAPRLRSWGRRLYHAPGENELRIHHYLPGIAGIVIAGGAAILTRADGHEALFGIPFGVGAGLTLDEVEMLAELDNPYWQGETVSLIQAGAATTAAAALGVGFYRRGMPPAHPDEHDERARGSERIERDQHGRGPSPSTAGVRAV